MTILCILAMTEAKIESKNDDSDSEEQNKEADVSPAVASQPQRIALFPGMDPSALKVSLKRAEHPQQFTSFCHVQDELI